MTRFGLYRRAVRLTLANEVAQGEMEDDAHHFVVTLRHDGQHIIEAKGEPVRTPWTLCPYAVGQLRRFVGLRLDLDAKSLMHDVGVTEQCTHMFDLAALLMRHVVRGTKSRIYRITLPIDDLQAAREAVLERDGVPALRWTIADQTILGPEPFAGLALRQVNAWARANFADPDELEAVAILHRAAFTSVARTMNLDYLTDATALEGKLGPCYVFRPGHLEQARRVVGSTIGFSDSRGPLPDARQGRWREEG